MIVIKKVADRKLETDVELNTDCFCPNCGEKEVYTAIGEGDYYEGPYNYCKNCKCAFTMPSCGVDENIEFISNAT
jgi:hypothetical protein